MAADHGGALAVVGQVDRTVAQPSDFQRLLPRSHESLGAQAGAGVSVVVAAHAGRNAGQRAQLLGRGVGAGRVVQARREAPRAFLHGLASDRFHVFHLGVGGRAIIPAYAPDADGRVAEDVGHVDGYGVVVLVQQLRHGQPVGGQGRVAVQPRVQPDVPLQFLAGLEGSVGYAVDAHQLGGDALPHLGVVVRLPQDGQPGVGVQVNEAGADDVAGGVDGPSRLQPGHVAPVDADPVALHRHSGKEPRAAGAVYDKTVGDEQVNHGLTSRG